MEEAESGGKLEEEEKSREKVEEERGGKLDESEGQFDEDRILALERLYALPENVIDISVGRPLIRYDYIAPPAAAARYRSAAGEQEESFSPISAADTSTPQAFSTASNESVGSDAGGSGRYVDYEIRCRVCPLPTHVSPPLPPHHLPFSLLHPAFFY